MQSLPGFARKGVDMNKGRNIRIALAACTAAALLFAGLNYLRAGAPTRQSATISPTAAAIGNEPIFGDVADKSGAGRPIQGGLPESPAVNQPTGSTHPAGTELNHKRQSTIDVLVPRFQGSSDAYQLVSVLREHQGGGRAAARVVSICLEWQEAATNKTRIGAVPPNDPRYGSWRHALTTLETACAYMPSADTMLTGALQMFYLW